MAVITHFSFARFNLGERWIPLLLASAGLGIVNTLVRPLMELARIPVTIRNLSIAVLLVNVLLISVYSFIVPGFKIKEFASVVYFILTISLFTVVIDGVAKRRD